MAFTGEGLRLTGFVSATNLSACQYRFVRVGSAAWNVEAAVAGCAVAPIGVLLNSPSTGQPAEVGFLGVFPLAVNAGTAINEGDNLICDASSMGSVITAASAATNARALEALASGCGIITALIFPTVITSSGDESV